MAFNLPRSLTRKWFTARGPMTDPYFYLKMGQSVCETKQFIGMVKELSSFGMVQ